MSSIGWRQLLHGWPWFEGEEGYPLAAYSEFMPPPRLGRKPYGDELLVLDRDDPWGWRVSEYEQALELTPGFEKLARQLLGCIVKLGEGSPRHSIPKSRLRGNPYWPPELAAHAGKLTHERYVMLAPLALSRTQDDKGRVRWTLFGGSEQGPARGFWKSFYTAPGEEKPHDESLDFVRRLLIAVYEEPAEQLEDLVQAGFRVLPGESNPDVPLWAEGELPSWTEPYIWSPGRSLAGVKYLLTFRPFSELPVRVRQLYLAGQLHLLPFPGSLVFWGAQPYHRLQEELPLALQIPVLMQASRHEGWNSLRVPQTGWLGKRRSTSAPTEDQTPVRNTFKRTHRTAKVLRHEDELALVEHADKMTHVLFSARSEDLGLYGKPMARNVQMWTARFKLVLDGPTATADDLKRALQAVARGGQFGYRFQYPAMRVGKHEVYWHRPLIAYLAPGNDKPTLLPEAPTGYLTAYLADEPDLSRPVELWPRLLQRDPHLAGLRFYEHKQHAHPYQTTLNIRKLLDTYRLLGRFPLPRALARALLTMPKRAVLEDWLELLPKQTPDPDEGQQVADHLETMLQPPEPPAVVRRKLSKALTYHRTSLRNFEVAYWKTIAFLAEGKYLTKNNADCVRDVVTQKLLPHHHRDLDSLGSYLLGQHARSVATSGVCEAIVGDLPFHWRTDFEYPWMGGWLRNQKEPPCERDLIVVIPGRDRSRAVVMADHYDTAYMADSYDVAYGGKGARLAAAGADDNHSATAALLQAAPIFLELSKAGRLACDIWLIHLTGEEFPADCLGARHLTRQLVQRTLTMRLPSGETHDLSKTRVQGVYVLDMVAHNNDRDRDVFQISPGSGRQSMWLAYQAHLATERWNASAPLWDRRKLRQGCGSGRRSPRGSIVPRVAKHPILHGEIRPPYDPRSTLYNTDGQIFSDAGVPVVLFMENYDINRTGYHDTHDTMANINLDYGAAVVAIAIEAVARAATEAPVEASPIE